MDDEDMDEDDDMMINHGSNGFHFDYNSISLRGSRTNCKGHWSKEEVRIAFDIVLNTLRIENSPSYL